MSEKDRVLEEGEGKMNLREKHSVEMYRKYKN